MSLLQSIKQAASENLETAEETLKAINNIMANEIEVISEEA